MWITHKTYITFEMPKDFEALCKFKLENDLSRARKYEDTMSVTYEFINNRYSKGEGDD